MEILKKLKEKGVSKWEIAKRVGVTWQTVHMWEKGTFKPSEARMQLIENILKEK